MGTLFEDLPAASAISDTDGLYIVPAGGDAVYRTTVAELKAAIGGGEGAKPGVPPVITDYTQVINAAATSAGGTVYGTSDQGGVFIGQPPRGGSDYTAELQLAFAPAGNWSFAAEVEADGITQGYDTFGISIYDAAGKRKTFGMGGHGGGTNLRNMNWTNIDSFAGETYTDYFLPAIAPKLWLRLKFDGTNLLLQFSQTGERWSTYWSESPTAFLTGPPTKVALGITANGGSVDKTGYFRRVELVGV